ncbi:MAG: cation-translocating P-type ATPase [Planctomycetota bacterium]
MSQIEAVAQQIDGAPHDHDHHHAGQDQRKVDFRIQATLLGGVILVVALLARWLFESELQSDLMAAGAAILMGAPIVWEAVKTVLPEGFKRRMGIHAHHHGHDHDHDHEHGDGGCGHDHSATHQLVTVALLFAFGAQHYVTAAGIAFLMLLAELLEERPAVGARREIESLVRITPTRAHKLGEDGSEQEVAAATLLPDDRVVIRPGDNIPGDGVIEAGQSTVNQANITGESVPVEKAIGDEVFSGTINESGVITVRITKAGKDSTLSTVKNLILQAAATRPAVVRMLDRYAGFYTPTILMIAAIVLFWTRDLNIAISLLLIACPVEIIMAGPTAMVAALSAAARVRVLIKSVSDLEIAQRVTAIVFDKTGTLTHGELRVTRMRPVEGVDAARLLRLAASLEANSRHPVARAVNAVAAKAKVQALPVEAFEEVAGRGVKGQIEGTTVMAGRRAWLEEQGVDCAALDTAEGEGMSLLAVAAEGQALGWLGLEDKARAEAAGALTELNDAGVKTRVMITGDAWGAARRVAREVGVTDVQAEALPGDKLALVRALRAKGHTVAVVGDGVNDGPALAAGDISIAMGAAGSDVAVESASIALMSNNLNRIPFLIHLSKRTITVVRQNLIGLMCYILLMIALLATGYINPLIAAVGHGVSGLAVIFNSARLFREGEHLSQDEDAPAPAAAQRLEPVVPTVPAGVPATA